MPAQATVTSKNRSRRLKISLGSFCASLLKKILPPAIVKSSTGYTSYMVRRGHGLTMGCWRGSSLYHPPTPRLLPSSPIDPRGISRTIAGEEVGVWRRLFAPRTRRSLTVSEVAKAVPRAERTSSYSCLVESASASTACSAGIRTIMTLPQAKHHTGCRSSTVSGHLR